MQSVVRFLKTYKLFSGAVVAVIICLILLAFHQHTAIKWILSSVAILEVLPLLWDMFQDLRSGKYGIDILAATAIIASVALGQYWAAILVVFMLTGGESLEDYAEHRANSELSALLERAPQKATVIRKGKTLHLKVSEIKVGDALVIKPGELVPADAVITEGSASFDESSLTGESLPVLKKVKDTILSGSINSDSAVTAKALATSADSQYEQIIKLVRSAASSQAPFVRLADRYSVPFTFMAYAIAAAVWVVSGHPIRFLEVIIVATPCPLLLAAPIALVSGMSRASKYGIIVKTGSALEKLAEAETIAFDKTGTLTSGIMSVSEIKTFNNHTKDEILGLAATLEQTSNHVLATAVTQAAQDKTVHITKAKHVQEISGRGLKAIIKGQEILVGRLSLLEESGVSVPAAFKKDSITKTAAYVGIAGKLGGVITFSDELRDDSKATLSRLHALGLKDMLLITGDNKAAALMIADQLNINHSNVHADALPADKLHVLDSVKKRPLVFVGDGVNDAPILMGSDVGIALGARGSTAASESADMVIMVDDVSRVATAYEIAKRTFKIASQSIVVGIGLSIILMLAFATGKFSPLLGAILQEVVDVVVIFNALRAHSGKLTSLISSSGN